MLPVLPFVAPGVAAAVAAWAGANWWARQRAGPVQEAVGGEADGLSPERPAGEARQLLWCPACRTYFVADYARACGAGDCPLDRPGAVP